jgi:hypothetical protein
MPLLARAAPALAALPAGVVKTAAYADGHWTFDLNKSEASTTTRLERQMNDAGLSSGKFWSDPGHDVGFVVSGGP